MLLKIIGIIAIIGVMIFLGRCAVVCIIARIIKSRSISFFKIIKDRMGF